MTVRGTSKMQKRRQGTARIAIRQENSRSRISDNGACAPKALPTYPVQEYFAHSGEKNVNMPPKTTEKGRQRNAVAPWCPGARKISGTQTLGASAGWANWNKPPPPVPNMIFKGRRSTRAEPNRDALDKLSEPQAQRGIIQAKP